MRPRPNFTCVTASLTYLRNVFAALGALWHKVGLVVLVAIELAFLFKDRDLAQIDVAREAFEALVFVEKELFGLQGSAGDLLTAPAAHPGIVFAAHYISLLKRNMN